MQRILLAIGVKNFEAALKTRLNGNDYVIVGEAIYKEAVLKAIKETAPDILIMTEGLTGNTDVLELITSIRRKYPKVRIIFIASGSRKPGDALLSYVASYGVYDILLGDIMIDALIDLIENPKDINDAYVFMPDAKLNSNNEPVFKTKQILVAEQEIQNAKNKKVQSPNYSGEKYYAPSLIEEEQDDFELTFDDSDARNNNDLLNFGNRNHEIEFDEDDSFSLEDDDDDSFDISDEDDEFDLSDDEDEFDLSEEDGPDGFDLEDDIPDEIEFEDSEINGFDSVEEDEGEFEFSDNNINGFESSEEDEMEIEYDDDSFDVDDSEDEIEIDMDDDSEMEFDMEESDEDMEIEIDDDDEEIEMDFEEESEDDFDLSDEEEFDLSDDNMEEDIEIEDEEELSFNLDEDEDDGFDLDSSDDEEISLDDEEFSMDIDDTDDDDLFSIKNDTDDNLGLADFSFDDSDEDDNDELTLDFDDENDGLASFNPYDEPEEEPIPYQKQNHEVYDYGSNKKTNLKSIKTFDNSKKIIGSVIDGPADGSLDDTDINLGLNKIQGAVPKKPPVTPTIVPVPIPVPTMQSPKSTKNDKYSKKKSPFGKKMINKNKNLENMTGEDRSGRPMERPMNKQKIITFVSPKAGVGNSQVAFSSALKIATTGAKVLYIETTEDGATLDYLYELGDVRGLDYILAGVNNFSDDTILRNIISIPDKRTSFFNSPKDANTIGKNAIKYFPDSFNYLLFSDKFRNESIKAPQQYNADKFLEMLTLLLSQYNFEYIIIDTDFDINNKLLPYILKYSSQIYITITQDMEVISRYLQNLKPYLDERVNKNINKYILLNKEEKISLTLNNVADIIEEPILASLPYMGNIFGESNYQGVPVLMNKTERLQEFFDIIARTSITK